MCARLQQPANGRRISFKPSGITDDAVGRIVRIKYRPSLRALVCQDEPMHRERANVIRFLAEEAAYAVDDFITAQLEAGSREVDVHFVLATGFRFEFVPCVDGVWRRGMQRETDDKLGAAMLAAIDGAQPDEKPDGVEA